MLIFHSGALGDFVLSWPLALALGRVCPQSRIVYVTQSQKGALAERSLRLESTDAEGGWHALFSEDVSTLSARATGLLAGAHAVYSFLVSPSVWTANVVRLQPAAKVVVIEPRAPDDFPGHASDWLLEQLRDHTIERAATEQMLRSIGDRGVGWRRSTGCNDVVIHPGSGSPAKCWPLPRFVELAKRLGESGKQIRFIIGEVERERWPAEQFTALCNAGDIRTPQTYVELLDELSTAGLFVGNDSGPGHLAGITGVPTVSIFGPTDPARWKPLGPRVSVVRAPSLAEVSVDAVFAQAMQQTAPDK